MKKKLPGYKTMMYQNICINKPNFIYIFLLLISIFFNILNI